MRKYRQLFPARVLPFSINPQLGNIQEYLLFYRCREQELEGKRTQFSISL